MNVRISKEQKVKVLQAEDIYKIMQQILLRENKIRRAQEHFWIVGLNNANKILFIELLCLGASNRVNIGPPDTFRMAIYKLAAKAILVHNHPAGETKYSKEDKHFTDYMLKAGKFLRIEVLDHLIITEKAFASFEELGIMDELRNNGNFEIVKSEKQELTQIEVLDHLIITEKSFASFEELEIMDELRNNGNFEIVKREKEELTQFKMQIEAERAEKKKAMEIAKNALKKNMPIKLISEITGLTEKQIEKL